MRTAVIPFLLSIVCWSAMVGSPVARGAEEDDQLLVGKWKVVGVVVNGMTVSKVDIQHLSVTNRADGTWSLQLADKEFNHGKHVLDATKSPKTIEFTPEDGDAKGNKFLGIYELGETTRKLCFAPTGKDRPKEFASAPGSEHVLVTFERVKEK